MNKYLISLVFLTGLTSCNLPFFKQDSTPTLENQQAQSELCLSAYDTLEYMVNNAVGLDATKKIELITKVTTERQKYIQLVKSQALYLESLGSVDWKKLIKDGWNLYKEIKETK